VLTKILRNPHHRDGASQAAHWIGCTRFLDTHFIACRAGNLNDFAASFCNWLSAATMRVVVNYPSKPPSTMPPGPSITKISARTMLIDRSVLQEHYAARSELAGSVCNACAFEG